MKKLVPIVLLLILTSTGYSQFNWFKPKPKAQPTPVAVVQKSKTPVQDAKQIVKELQSELRVAKSENAKLKDNLSKANGNLKDSFLQIDKLKKDIDALKEWGVVQQAEAQKWLSSYTSAVKRYHRLKNIAAAVAGLFGAMVGMWCMRFVPPVYAAYAFALPIVGAGAAASALWIFL
jgi:hypothetical protein